MCQQSIGLVGRRIIVELTQHSHFSWLDSASYRGSIAGYHLRFQTSVVPEILRYPLNQVH